MMLTIALSFYMVLPSHPSRDIQIDPDLPPARKAYIATNSGASIVFTTPNEAKIFAAEFASESEGTERERLPGVVVPEEDLSEVVEGGGEEEGDVNMAQLDGLAYLLYTSGTLFPFLRHPT